jgi:hypothetical protein
MSSSIVVYGSNINFKQGEAWTILRSLRFNTILQLGLFYKRLEKWPKISYVQLFMALYQNTK